MPDSKVSNLTAASALTGVELFYADDGTNDVKVTATQIKTFAVGAGAVSVASGKTLTVSNTLTLAGTDGKASATMIGRYVTRVLRPFSIVDLTCLTIMTCLILAGIAAMEGRSTSIATPPKQSGAVGGPILFDRTVWYGGSFATSIGKKPPCSFGAGAIPSRMNSPRTRKTILPAMCCKWTRPNTKNFGNQ